MYHETPKYITDGGLEDSIVNTPESADTIQKPPEKYNKPKATPEYDFEVLITSKEVANDLMLTCYRLTRNSYNPQEDAKDLFNTTIASALVSKIKYNKNPAELKSWLGKLARNRYIDGNVRKTKAVKRGSGIKTELINEAITKADELNENEKLQQIQIRTILDAMESNNDPKVKRQAEIIKLTFFEGLNTEEIEKRMGISEATIKREKAKAFEKLRNTLK